MSTRVLFYVQHLLGTGHQQRSAAIASALAEDPGIDVHYVSGGMPLPNLSLGRCHFHQLPPARASDARYSALVDEHGKPVTAAWRSDRARQLLALLAQVAPALIVTETFPFGRNALRFELEPLIDAATARGIALVCSVRDIIEPREDTGKLDRMAATVCSHYRSVLVHGDPNVLAFSETFPAWDRIAARVHYTGYVVSGLPTSEDPPREHPPDRDGPVLVSCGGGRVGSELLRAASRAAQSTRRPERAWDLRAGENVDPACLRALRGAAGARLIVGPNRSGFIADLARAAVSVSQAGYNTVAQVVATATPAVFVPYDGEREQTLRAQAFAEAGAAQWLSPRELTPDTLALAVERAFDTPVARLAVALDGVEKSVQHIRQALRP